MIKPSLQVIRVKFDLPRLSGALYLPPQEVIEAFRDGRGAWPFSELWGQRLFEFAKHKSTNVPLSDGLLELQHLGNLNVSIKALGKGGVKFQQSIDVGGNRRSTRERLISALEACDRVIVVDVQKFPEVLFYPLDTGRLISAAHTGNLTTNGWSVSRFQSWTYATYDVLIIDTML